MRERIGLIGLLVDSSGKQRRRLVRQTWRRGGGLVFLGALVDNARRGRDDSCAAELRALRRRARDLSRGRRSRRFRRVRRERREEARRRQQAFGGERVAAALGDGRRGLRQLLRLRLQLLPRRSEARKRLWQWRVGRHDRRGCRLFRRGERCRWRPGAWRRVGRRLYRRICRLHRGGGGDVGALKRRHQRERSQAAKMAADGCSRRSRSHRVQFAFDAAAFAEHRCAPLLDERKSLVCLTSVIDESFAPSGRLQTINCKADNKAPKTSHLGARSLRRRCRHARGTIGENNRALFWTNEFFKSKRKISVFFFAIEKPRSRAEILPRETRQALRAARQLWRYFWFACKRF